MAQRKSRDQRVVRNRRVMIYTFLIILALFYISAHRKLEKERAAEAVRVAEAAGMDLAVDGDGAAAGSARAGDARAGDAAGEDATVVRDGLKVTDDHNAARESGDAGLAVEGRTLPDGQIYEGSKHSGGMGDAEELSISQDDMWCLILTNAEYPVPEDYAAELKTVPGTEQSVDERIYEPLMRMLEDMKAQGLSPVVCSGYRTLDKQEKLFNRKVQSYVRRGHTKEESYTLARQTISIPGSGEHCLGLAVDFYTNRYHKLERAFEKTPEGQWLMENAQDYGFIMRYGEDKADITGIEYEPWHYRYVGVEAAKYMKEHNLSLEEFYIEQSLYG